LHSVKVRNRNTERCPSTWHGACGGQQFNKPGNPYYKFIYVYVGPGSGVLSLTYCLLWQPPAATKTHEHLSTFGLSWFHVRHHTLIPRACQMQAGGVSLAIFLGKIWYVRWLKEKVNVWKNIWWLSFCRGITYSVIFEG